MRSIRSASAPVAPVAPVAASTDAAESSVPTLAQLVHEACHGRRLSLDAAAYELRGRLIRELTPLLDELEVSVDPEDVAHDVILALLEGHVHPRRTPGLTLAAVVRGAKVLARRRAREWCKHWGIDADGRVPAVEAEDDVDDPSR
jgi:hypothetical protein